MQRPHGILLNSSTKTVSHHHIGAVPQLLDEARDVPEIVAVISVPHYHVFAARAGDSSHKSVAISLGSHIYNPCPHSLRNLDRAVGAAIVSHNNFSRYIGPAESALRLPDATLQRLSLVQARHDHRHFDGRRLLRRHSNRLIILFRS